ncbi:hypothetical protein APD30_09305 [Acinetobacter baumannii]|nr:hypothetical protein APD30_09305 [Acinetobacter baumannii]
MKNLIVVRCGDKSLHEKWVSTEANYDIALSYFGDNPKFDIEKIRPLAKVVIASSSDLPVQRLS